jgi:hypothetical protein
VVQAVSGDELKTCVGRRADIGPRIEVRGAEVMPGGQKIRSQQHVFGLRKEAEDAIWADEAGIVGLENSIRTIQV